MCASRSRTSALASLPAALLLSACGGDPVVSTLAVGPRPIAGALMRDPGTPKCELQEKGINDLYAYEEIDASRRCWRQAWRTSYGRVRGLQKAVRVREAAVAKATTAAN